VKYLQRYTTLALLPYTTLFRSAADLGLQLVSRRLTRDDLYIADEAFFAGAAAEITPIREIDGRRIGAGKRGPITEQLQAAFFDRSEEHTSELQSRENLVCRLPL